MVSAAAVGGTVALAVIAGGTRSLTTIRTMATTGLDGTEIDMLVVEVFQAAVQVTSITRTW